MVNTKIGLKKVADFTQSEIKGKLFYIFVEKQSNRVRLPREICIY